MSYLYYLNNTMKLLRFGDPGNEKPGVLIKEDILDVSSFGEDFGEQFFGSNGIQRLQTWVASNMRQTSQGQFVLQG